MNATRAASIIIDTDIGFDIDDAYALAFALKGGLHVAGISTVSGDTVKRGRIAKKMLGLAGKDAVPVFAGKSSRALLTYDRWVSPSEDLDVQQGIDGMVEMYWREIERARDEKLQIVAIGPLSNVALVRERDPSWFDDRVQLLLMGGQFKTWLYGLNLHVPEYNIAMDKTAARSVLAASLPTRIVPLDVTACIQLTRQDMALLEGNSAQDMLIQALIEMTRLFKASLIGHRAPILYDLATIVPLIDPTILSFTSMLIEVTRGGFTRVPRSQRTGLIAKEICTKIDMDRLYDLLFRILIEKPRAR